MLELFGVVFITLFIAFLFTLVFTNLAYMMFKKGNVEFIDCKWDEDRKEINEVQEKYLETLPKHKTRIKLRNKRKGKK